MAKQQLKRRNSIQQSFEREQELVKRRLRLSSLLLASVILFTLLLSLTLPWAAQGALARGFRQGLLAKTVLADIKTRSTWHLLIGKSESMELMMEFDDTSLLSLSLLSAHWGPSNVALGLMRQGHGGERDAEPSDTELYWNEANLAAYLNRVQGEVLVSRVQISEQQVEIYGSIVLNGSRHNIYVAARPKSDDLGRVVFPAHQWRAEGLDLTSQLQESICEALSFYPDLSPLAWKVWAKQVALSPGQMLVYGSSSCCR